GHPFIARATAADGLVATLLAVLDGARTPATLLRLSHLYRQLRQGLQSMLTGSGWSTTLGGVRVETLRADLRTLLRQPLDADALVNPVPSRVLDSAGPDSTSAI